MVDKLTPLQEFQKISEGTIVISPDGSSRSSHIRVDSDAVSLTSPNPSIGIYVDGGGITIQGSQLNTAFGSSIAKGPYTENDNSSKPYTYAETVYFESVAKETAYNAAAQVMGTTPANLIIQYGFVPIITDVSSGPLPHVHTISMKHVHRVEPAYIYEMPISITSFKSGIQSFLSFLT